jgi:peroxiredoxin
VELSENQSEFDRLGIQVAVVTYESPEISSKFSDQYNVSYPILSDTDSKYIKAWGLLNEAYQPGSRVYGVPHPGIFLIDGNGIIHSKFSEEGYKNRPILKTVIDAAKEMVASN